MLEELQKNTPLNVKLFYTRPHEPATDGALGDGSQGADISLRAGQGRLSRSSILDSVGVQLGARIAEVVALISGPPGAACMLAIRTRW
jgi:hypothetical protein